MQHTQEEYSFLAMRQTLLEERIQSIRALMVGDTVSVGLLLCDEQGAYSDEIAWQLVDELTDNIDNLQKSWWIEGGIEHDERTDARLEASPAWQELHRSLHGLEDEASYDLTQAPSTLSPEERTTVRATLYCLLRACSCPALGVSSVGALRRLLEQLGTLVEMPAFGDEEQSRSDPTQQRLTRDALICHELSVELANEGDFFNERSTPFDLLDSLWHELHDGSVTTLDAPEAVEHAWASSEGRKLAEDLHMASWVADQQDSEPGLRGVSGVDETLWRGLSERERLTRVLTALDTCSDEALLALEDDDFFFLGSFFGWATIYGGEHLTSAELGNLGAWWQRLDHEGRVQALRAYCDWHLEAFDAAERGETDPDLDAMYEALEEDARSFSEGVRAWAAHAGCIDTLFEQYALVRSHIFVHGLPQGAFKGDSRHWGRWYPERFGQLASVALELALGERGLSYLADGKTFHRVYARLGEAEHQLRSMTMQHSNLLW